MSIKSKTQWAQNQLHGQFIRQTMVKVTEDGWRWLSKMCFKRTTEALIIATQEQATRTNNTQAKIDKTTESCNCSMCGKAEDSVNHVLRVCSELAQKEYKRQHDWFGAKIHWEICRKCGI